MRLEKWLSGLSDRIITNSQAALNEYQQKGYPRSKLAHIPNAIDIDRFRPDPDSRISVRNELGISENAPLIGLFARLHPMKDHPTFLRAARIIVEQSSGVSFICAGGTSNEYSAYERQIRTKATEMGLDDHITWPGARTDPERLMAACDITTLTSDSGEGFPNSVAESMACGTPCVVTDVGDAASIVSVHGAAVPRTNPEELAEAWKMVLDKDPYASDRASAEGRQSIIDRYSSAAIARATLDVLSQ
ncbi:MAG: glycosyltransferase [Chloroflexi bacterium]|nr:glycosyltransferase [Chloroflexota bacterium]